MLLVGVSFDKFMSIGVNKKKNEINLDSSGSCLYGYTMIETKYEQDEFYESTAWTGHRISYPVLMSMALDSLGFTPSEILVAQVLLFLVYNKPPANYISRSEIRDFAPVTRPTLLNALRKMKEMGMEEEEVAPGLFDYGLRKFRRTCGFQIDKIETEETSGESNPRLALLGKVKNV